MTSSKPVPYDPQIAPTLKAQGLDPAPPAPTLSTLPMMRTSLGALANHTHNFRNHPHLSHKEDQLIGPDGKTIALTIVAPTKKKTTGLRPGIFYLHGGGMILGTQDFLLDGTFPWVEQLDAVLVSPDYRLAPEHQHPALLEDCWTALEWFVERIPKLGIDPEKVMVAGHSAGGGLAAGIALLARDREVKIKFCAQMLIYPMLDDRMITVSSEQMMDDGPWTGKLNIVAWEWYLGPKEERDGLKDVEYAAPARMKDLSGLPPTFIDVGTAEPFRDEDINYAMRLLECGVKTELHVYEGVYHGADIWTPESDVMQACLSTRLNWLKRNFPSAVESVAISSL
ncbi:hypothetical protein HYALB_00011862 [Hymenoscyphus albidus]|uniref:Alpha/beta hydrolase fold-3 domain-containing protein n=1 Tax=Hymenoscyphus albidus TaxID=595503 RepID=A0A9N9LMF0_9HELO|nr:hypothetical protein HYALB_00011862 [Hymenoscyphus albidus]